MYPVGRIALGARTSSSRTIGARASVWLRLDSARRSLIGVAEIREQSSRVITREDVMAVDTKLIDEVTAKRGTHDILIDSHPVTKEPYGFRLTPFKVEQVKAFSPDAIGAPASTRREETLSFLRCPFHAQDD
jgi:hypothetical protein